MKKHVLNTLITISALTFVVVCVIIIVRSIEFKQQCRGHLKRAAGANTIELAKQELNVAITYMEDNELISGYTSVLYKTPDEDIGFWYSNIKASYDDLCSTSDTATQLLKSNVLMKLRETLLGDNDGLQEATCPNGISRYPENLLFGLIFYISSIVAVILIIIRNIIS